MVDLIHPEWMLRGLCSYPDIDPEIFFPKATIYSRGRPTSGELADRRRRAVTKDERAKAICRDCPVLSECFEYAVASPHYLYGIWGGTNEFDRAEVRKRRPYLRRRKENA